jgi:hypothetical protein
MPIPTRAAPTAGSARRLYVRRHGVVTTPATTCSDPNGSPLGGMASRHGFPIRQHPYHRHSTGSRSRRLPPPCHFLALAARPAAEAIRLPCVRHLGRPARRWPPGSGSPGRWRHRASWVKGLYDRDLALLPIDKPLEVFRPGRQEAHPQVAEGIDAPVRLLSGKRAGSA